MNSFDIPSECQLANITFYQMNLLSSELKENEIDYTNYKLSNFGATQKIIYNACREEGFLNIPVARCNDNRCFIHLYGKMNGVEFKSASKIGNYNYPEFNVINERIKYILTSSKHTFRRYYQSSDIDGIKEHLTAFLFVF